MTSRAQVLDLLRRNAMYNDSTGSSNGAGYIGGRRRKTMGSGYIGGCMNCMNAGCKSCCGGIRRRKPSARGGYKGMAKDLDQYLVNNRYPNAEYPCEWANPKNANHYAAQDLADAMRHLRLQNNDLYSGNNTRKIRTAAQEASAARLMLKGAFCNPTAKQRSARQNFGFNASENPTSRQLAARRIFKLNTRLVRELMDQRGLSRQQAWDMIKKKAGPMSYQL